MKPKGIWNIVAALAVVALAWSCTQPTQPDPPKGSGDQSTIVTVIIGPSPSAGGGSCQSPDEVRLTLPGTIQHGTPSPISATPILGGQVQQSNVCPITWSAQAPCFVANPGQFNTSVNATAQDLSGCSIQATVGATASPVGLIQVN